MRIFYDTAILLNIPVMAGIIEPAEPSGHLLVNVLATIMIIARTVNLILENRKEKRREKNLNKSNPLDDLTSP